jgi:FkbM family methyltransferase
LENFTQDIKFRIYSLIQKVFRKLGINITQASRTLASQRKKILNQLGITLILDVGANCGQYACELRSAGYSGKIISFEPLNDAFCMLNRNAEKDKNHECYKIALGSKNEIRTINVSANSVSSSLLSITETHIEAEGNATVISNEEIEVKALHDIHEGLFKANECVFLKIDAQGFEKEVLVGAKDTLSLIKAIEVELSFDYLYHEQSLFYEICQILYKKGFTMIWFERKVLEKNTDFILQGDAIFLRKQINNK